MRLRCLIVLLFCFFPQVHATTEARYITSGPSNREAYFIQLIEAALSATQQAPGDYRVTHRTEPLSTERKLHELVDGDLVNIAWLPISEDPGPKARMIKIPTPILGGALGYRIAVVRASQPDLLKHVHSIDDLKRLKLGQGQNWAEIPIYNANSLEVFEALNMNTMLKMLAGGRFDYFPLGVIEVEDSYDLEGDGIIDLVADPHLLIHYNFPVYFYVSSRAPALAERMARGMQILAESGQLNAIFSRHFNERLQQLALTQRRLLHLPHPFFDQRTESLTTYDLLEGRGNPGQ